MSTKLSYRDGGKTSEEGFARLIAKLFTEDGVVGDNDLLVTEQLTPDNTVKIAVGDILMGDSAPEAGQPDYIYNAWVTVADSVTIAANTSGNPRIDAIVAYIDKSVVSSTNNDNPGALKFKDVDGTAAATPVAPTDAEIQTDIGAGNPWVLLAHVAVANGFSSIVNANITDKRPKTDTKSRLVDDLSQDFVATGLVTSQVSGLGGQITAGAAYIDGQRVTKPLMTKTFTASKDTYIDLPKTAKPTTNDDYTYTAVANGAAAPALASGSIRIAKVVTDGSAITSVTTAGVDSNGVLMYNTNPIINHLKVTDRQDNTSNSTVSDQRLCYGWGFIQGNTGVKSVAETVTLPFTYNTTPVIVAGNVGAKSSSPSLISDFDEYGTLKGIDVRNITTSNFQIEIFVTSDVNFADTKYYGYSWITLGTKV